jgi:hypothetical protein
MKEGDASDKECPKCKTPLVFEMSFQDQWDYRRGHYTTDFPVLVCPTCDYCEDFAGEEDEYERE